MCDTGEDCAARRKRISKAFKDVVEQPSATVIQDALRELGVGAAEFLRLRQPTARKEDEEDARR